MQQGGGSQSHQYLTGGGGAAEQHQQSSKMEVEEASPISSRPPASIENLDDYMAGAGGSGGFSEIDALATAATGDDADRGGGGSGAGGNRWPRHETLALLRIRMEMDAAFREATVKGPLWEDVSRKLAELGYKRSAKKCKEKFENVDKYYKRTKEGRVGRQDGKSYKFFSELEALHNISTPHPAGAGAAAAAPSIPSVISFSAGVGYSSPMPISSIRPLLGPTAPISPVPLPPHESHFFQPATAVAEGALATFTASPMGLDFSSDSSSSSRGTEDDDEEENGGSDDMEGEPSDAAAARRSRKRKRSGGEGGGGSRRRMMELFERLMKQVMKKQEAMQHGFLEAIKKREQERMIREEAWRRQEMVRLAREHEIMARERAVTASRDDAIIAFLQKITGQTIHLPQAPPPPPIITINTTTAPVAAPTQQQPSPVPQPVLHVPPLQYQQKNPQQRQVDVVLAAVPEQQVRPQLEDAGGSGGRGSEPPSSRWPKTEVLALIKLRSGLETRYQEAGPKGPLWEEISAGMQRMGYKRSAKRCKEKWENINKYYKKVKESSKKRPEDSKTCPYYHELDALYQKKIFAGSSSIEASATATAGGNAQQAVHHEVIDKAPVSVDLQKLQPGSLTIQLQASKDGDSIMEEGNGHAKKPEDTVKELMIRRGGHQNRPDLQQKWHVESSSGEALRGTFQSQHCPEEEEEEYEDNDIMEGNEYDDNDAEDEEEEGGGDGDLQGGRRTATSYRVEYQQKSSSRQNPAGPPDGGGGGAAPETTSFTAMVQ
ncbi:hypothetical protein SAY87_031608 [Trapa incisa]|uniref:Myb-like domain-containing protein n=1 Tax=Trapa incisa TaxID=236973 RepID=A0AAN7QLU4_9MYRT|nr:hypothetical protein SAY87_031608 [Trapa incisa]